MENTPSTLITRIRQRLFGVESAPVGQVATTMDEDVPRYPPFMKGLPAAPLERILSSQTELIAAIEQALAGTRQAVAAGRFPERTVESSAAPMDAAGAREIPEAEAIVARADALLAYGRISEAGQAFQEAARRWPKHPAPAAGLGYLALRRPKPKAM